MRGQHIIKLDSIVSLTYRQVSSSAGPRATVALARAVADLLLSFRAERSLPLDCDAEREWKSLAAALLLLSIADFSLTWSPNPLAKFRP